MYIIHRPIAPNFVYAGMMVCHDDPPQLEEGPLKEFVDGAGEDGVVVVSFGSGVVMNSQMSSENLRTFVRTLSGLKERVVWKWEGGREELLKRTKLPPNVFVSSWLPQQSLASHPNVKLIVMQVTSSMKRPFILIFDMDHISMISICTSREE